MQPDSGAFIALLVVLTIGALALCVWTWGWPRLRFARRMATLGVSQLLIVLCVVASFNASQNFFVTWDELLQGAGAGAVDDAPPVVALPPQNGSAGKNSGAAASQLQGAVDAAEKRYHTRPKDQAAAGIMVSTAIRGSRTAYALPARVYFPAAYFESAHASEKFPVIMFYTGYVGGLDVFQYTLGANLILDKAIEEKKIPPSLVVIPQQNPHLPADSECVNAVRGDQAETYLALDVPDVVRSDLRVSTDRSKWALMGYSTGGFCAANMAIHHPEEFASVVSLSGYFHAVTDSSTGDLYKGDAPAKKANTPTQTVGLPRQLPLSFYLAASGGDREGMAGIKEFSPKIKAPDQLTKAMAGKTGHNFATWKHAMPDAFAWLGKAFTETHAAQASGPATQPSPTQSPKVAAKPPAHKKPPAAHR
jgi:enterochelin esterase-like enzyme